MRTARNGQKSSIQEICIPGKSIRFVIVPDVLVYSPMAKKFSLKAKELAKMPKATEEGPSAPRPGGPGGRFARRS